MKPCEVPAENGGHCGFEADDRREILRLKDVRGKSGGSAELNVASNAQGSLYTTHGLAEPTVGGSNLACDYTLPFGGRSTSSAPAAAFVSHFSIKARTPRTGSRNCACRRTCQCARR